MAESEEELKNLLMSVKEKSEKDSLKLHIQKTKILASNSIISWQKEGGKLETATDFIFFGFKVTAVGDCSHEIKRCILLGRKAMTNLDCILKSRDITLLTKVLTLKSMFFWVVTYRGEWWIIQNAEHQEIQIFELCSWSRLLRASWTARTSSQTILKEINPNTHWKDWCWSWSSNIWSTDAKKQLTGKTLMLGKIEGKWRGEQHRMRWLGNVIDSMDMHLSKLWKIVKDRGDWHACKGSDPI